MIKDGFPEEAVDARKIKRISRAAMVYLFSNGLDEATPCRFDVVAIQGSEIRLYENAFTYL